MTTINTGVAELLAVRVPEGFWAAHVNEYGDIEAYHEDGGGGTKPIAWHKYKSDMPPGDYEPLGLASSLTDEQWGKVVDRYGGAKRLWWKDYQFEKSKMWSAAESGLSLLAANGLVAEKTFLMIKK